jgi:hypothetical protein
MFLNELQADSALYFNRVPRDVVNYTKREYFPLWTVGTHCSRQQQIERQPSVCDIGVFSDNTYAFGNNGLSIVWNDIRIDQMYYAMIIDADDALWLQCKNCVIKQYAKNGNHTGTLSFMFWQWLYNVCEKLPPARVGVFGSVIARPSCRRAPSVDIHNTVELHETHIELVNHSLDGYVVLNSIFHLFPTKPHGLVIDAARNIIISFAEVLQIYNSDLELVAVIPFSVDGKGLAVDKNGSILCSTKTGYAILDTY